MSIVNEVLQDLDEKKKDYKAEYLKTQIPQSDRPKRQYQFGFLLILILVLGLGIYYYFFHLNKPFNLPQLSFFVSKPAAMDQVDEKPAQANISESREKIEMPITPVHSELASVELRQPESTQAVLQEKKVQGMQLHIKHMRSQIKEIKAENASLKVLNNQLMSSQDRPVIKEQSAEEKTNNVKLVTDQEVSKQNQIIASTIKQWAENWSSKNFEAYRGFYETGFKGRFLSHQEWLNDRKNKILKAEFIHVSVTDLKIRWSGELAKATFKQKYRSNNYQDETLKELTLKSAGDRWIIVTEKALTQFFNTGADESASETEPVQAAVRLNVKAKTNRNLNAEYQFALNAFEQQNYNVAVNSLLKLLNTTIDLDARLLLSRVYQNSQQRQALYQHVETSLERYPDDENFRYLYALDLFNRQQYQQVLNYLSFDSIKDHHSYVLLGNAYQKMNFHQSAIKAFKASLSIKKLGEVWVSLGLSFEKENQLKQAKVAYQQALAFDRLSDKLKTFLQNRLKAINIKINRTLEE